MLTLLDTGISMKFLLKITIRLLIITALLLVAAYAAAPYLIENVLLRQLEQQGFENVSIRSERPHWNALKLNWLSFESQQGSVKWLLEARDAEAKINPFELLRGNLPTLRVEQAYLKIDSRSRSEVSVQSDFTLELPAQWLTLLPLRSFDVEQLLVSWQGKEIDSKYVGAISGNRIADRIQLELSIERQDSQQGLRYAAVLLMTTSGRLTLSVVANEKTNSSPPSLLSVKARLTDRNDAIEISKAALVFDTLALNQLGEELRLFTPLEAEISGQVTFTSHGHINKKIVAGSPIKYHLLGEVYAKLDSIATPFYAYDAVAEVYASFDIDHVSTDITIDSKSKVETTPPDELLAFAKASPELFPLAADQPLRINVVQPLHFQSSLALGQLVGLRQWPMTGLITASLPLTDGQQWQFSFDSPSVNVSDVITFNSRYVLQLPLNQLDLKNGYVAPSQLDLSGLIGARSDQISVSVDHQSSWRSSQARFDEKMFNNLQLGIRKELVVNYDIAMQRWQSNNAKFELIVDPVHVSAVDDFIITPSKIDIDIEQALGVADKWNIRGQLLADILVKNTSANDSLRLHINAPFTADQHVLAGTNTLSFDQENKAMGGEFTYNWHDATGGMNWQVVASPVNHWLETLIVLMPSIDVHDLQLDEGALDVELSLLLLKDKTKAKASIRLTGIVGSYGEIVLNGGTSRIIIDDVFALSSKKKSIVELGLLDVGFPIKNIRFNVQPMVGENGSIEFVISDASAHLLGGRVGLENWVWRPNEASQFDLSVQGVDIEEVLALEQQASLTGSGILDGMIPIIVSSDGEIVVDSGRLQARDPGGEIVFLREAEGDLGKTNPSLDYTLKALENFQYDNLVAELFYKPSGKMLLMTSIAGHNPDFENGSLVNLNVNLELNVKSLLQSLQLADDLADKIDQRIQHGLKKKADN